MTRQELAQKVKAKYPELQGVDDETVVASVLDQHPSYSAYLTDDDIGSNVVIESAKQFGLGAAETVGQAAEGAVLNLSLSMAEPTMTEQEFYNSPESLKNVSYDRYVRLNNIKLEKQKKGMEFADAIKGWTEEKLPEYLNADEEYGNRFAGQVFRGLGQFLGYGTVGTAGTLATGNPMGGVAAVYGTAFFNRQIEFLEDAERTLGLDLMEMDQDTRDKIVGGSWAYGLTTGALDATVFKYITRVPGANTPTVKNLLSNLVRGQAVPSGQLKTVLMNTGKAAIAEGTQESLGDGLTLDALAKSLYDDDRELITGDALARRQVEFMLGGTVGGLGKTGIDLIRAKPRTEEEVKKFKDVLKKVDEKLKTVEGETDQQKFKIQFKQKASGETDITEVKASSPEEALEIFNETYKGMYEPDSGSIYTGEVEVQETAPEEEVVEEEVVEDQPKVLTQSELQLGARKFRDQAQQAPVKQSDIAHEKTQRSNTIKTYDIINKSKYMPKDGKVLDFGAGLGEGAALMGAESFEPNPQAGFEPTYTNPDEIPSNSYDFVTSLSVLNVIPGRQVRDEVVKDIGRILKKNGKAVITARSDVDSYYKKKPELKTEEFGEVGYISGDRTYQKNFKQKELVDYIQDVLGEGFKVTPLDVSVSGSSVLIEKVAESTYEALQEAVMATDEEDLRLGARRLKNQIDRVDDVIDNPTTVDTDPGEGGKVRSIAKKYQLEDSEVLDFQDSKNITKGANRIARVLEKAFGQFPKFSKWYSSRLKMALSILEELDPDIKKPEDSFITKVLLAITSNGNEVSPQTEESYRIYQEWKKTGSVVVSETSGTRKGAIIDHLNLFQDLLNKHGYKKVRKFLSTTGTVKELREELVNNFGFSKKVATDVTNGELIDEQVPFSLIFGAKLGSFFNNLNGNFDTTTMDRWFMRTFGRTMGQQLVKIDNSKQKKRFFDSIESLLADKDQSVFLDKKIYKSKDTTVRDLLPVDGNVDPLNLKRIIVFFGKPENRMFDGKPLTTKGKPTKGSEKINEFRAAVNNFHKKFDGLEIWEAPRGGSHRRFIRQVMDKALTKFNKKNNVNFTPAEAQALLWYYEKLVHDSNGSRQKDEAPDYGSAANKLYRKLRGTDSSRFRTSDAVRRRTPISGGDQAVSQGEQPAGVGRVSARRPKTNAEVELDIVANFTQNYLNDKFGSIIESDEFKLPSGKKLKLYMGVDAGVFGPQDQDSTASYDPVTHRITVNLRNMNAKTFTKESLSATMREEIIHALAAVRAVKKYYGKDVTTDNLFALAQAEYFENLGKNLSQSQRSLIEKVYNYGDPMNDYTAGAEYFRAAVQNFSYGMITEETNTMKEGKAWDTVKKLIRDLQAFVTKAFKLTSDPQGVALIADVANLLAKIDPEARPVDQKTVLAARKVISPVTGEPVLDVGDFTEDPIVKAKKSILKPLLLPKKDGKMTFAEAYLVPAGQTLRNIHASLEKVFTDYVKGKDQRIHELHRLAESFALKFKGIKDKADKQALTQLISFSKFDNEGSQFTDEQAQELYSKRDALLDKYGMFNEYLAITQALKQIRHEVMTYVGEIGFVENYWPRYLSPKKYKELREKYGLDKKTFEDEIKAQNEERKANTVTAYRVVTYDEAGLEVPGNLYPTRGEAQAEVDSLGNSFVKKEEVNKPLPPMEKGGVEEALFIEKLLTGRGFDPKAGKPKFTKTRKLEIIPEEDLEFYDSPTKALSRYFTSMVSLIETTKFIGRMQPDTRVIKGQTVYQYDPRSKMAQTVQDLINRPEFADSVNQEKLYQTLPEITRMLMAKGGKEFGLFAWFRQFSYGTLLIEFTSTLSQLYDLPFTMYDNGFFETLRSAANVATGKGVADVRELFDINRIMDAYENDSDFFADVIKTGLKITGFTKMDQFMKETTMDANYKRYLKVSKDINPDGTIKDGLRGKRLAEAKKALKELNIFLASTDPDFQQQDIQRFLQAVKTEPNQRTQYQNDLIKSVLIVKLFENQPMNILRLPPKISENPNLRGLITMKSFMLVQINSTRNIALNDLFGNGRTKTERAKAFLRLTKLIGFFIAIGIPVDALKDWLVGRPGYLPDYAFNGAVRVFGINKFLFFQLRKEGLGQAMLDFTLPVPLARGIGVLNEMSAVAQGEGPIESGIVKNMPFSDVFYYRVPEVREKQRKFVQRRRKQEGEFLFGLPDPFEQLAPEPLVNPFR